MGAASNHLLPQHEAYGGCDVLSEMPWNLETEQWTILGHPWNPSSAEQNDYGLPNTAFSAYPNELNDPLPISEGSNDEVIALLADCVGAAANSDSASSREELISHLDDNTVEMHDGQLMKNVEKLKGPSKLEPVLQLIRYSVYLSSNNLLPDSKTDKLVQWMTKSGAQWVLDLLLDLKTPTTEIFGSNILVSAARLGNIDIVRILIAKKADVNALAGYTYRKTALQEAVRLQHPRIVCLLLDAGASPKPQIGSQYSVLHDALAGAHSIEIVQMLIDKGADVNGPFVQWLDEAPVLVCAAGRHDLVMTRMLLEAGAHVNEMLPGSTTALQASIGKDAVDVAQILIDAGASIDAPEGRTFAEAREASVKNRDFEQLTTPIQRAALADDIELVQTLVSEGADVNACPWEGCKDDIRIPLKNLSRNDIDFHDVMTALQAAVFSQNATLVRVILGADADINARGFGDTALQIAATGGDAKICQILLRHGADVNAPADDYHGRTALQAAASTGDCELVQQLLDAGADVNAIASPTGGRTALQAAAEHGSVELVKALIAADGNINAAASPTEGRTCLQAAGEQGHTELVQMLLSAGADVNSPAAKVSNGLTALQAALTLHPGELCLDVTWAANKKFAHTTILQTLLNAGADVNAPPSPQGGISALVAAIKSRNLELARSLLQRGAKANCRNSEQTALGEAVNRRSTELVALLIEAGADVDAYYHTDENLLESGTPLQAAALSGSIQIATVLLNAGATVDKPSAGSCLRTALQCAVHGNCAEMVLLLLANGADPNACATVCKHSSTALGYALSRWSINIDILSALINAGADVNKIARPRSAHPVRQAAAKSNAEAVQLLLEAGACINLTSEDKCTALQAASGTRNIDLIKILIGAGADVNAPAGPERGRTALQQAVEHGDIKISRLLLAHGADVNAPAGYSRGITALQGAMMNGHLKIVLMLLQAGAQVNAPPANAEGRMALDAAAEHGRLDIVLLLLKNDEDAEAIELRCKRAAKLAALNGHLVIARILRGHRRGRGSTA